MRTPKDYGHVLERHDLATVLVARFSKVDTSLYVCATVTVCPNLMSSCAGSLVLQVAEVVQSCQIKLLCVFAKGLGSVCVCVYIYTNC